MEIRTRARFLAVFAAAEFSALYIPVQLDGDVRLIAAVPCAFAAVAVLLLALLSRNRVSSKALSAMLLTAAVTAGAALGIFLCRSELNVKRDLVRSYIGKTVTIEGEITEVVYEESFGSVFYADISSVDGGAVSFPLKLEFDRAEELQICEKFRCEAEIRDLVRTNYVYGDSYIESKGIYASALCGDVVRLGTSKGVRYFSQQLNAAASDALTAVTGEGADIANALLLGRRDGLSDTLKRDFRSLGISHILALSGMHFSVMIGSLGALLTVFRMRRIPKYVVLALFSAAYAFLVGFGVTVSRAAIMILLFCLAKLIGRQADSLTSLSAAAIIITAFSPSSAYNAGFQLSFAAALGIIMLSPEARLAAAHITARQSVGETRAQKFKRRVKGWLLLFPLALYTGISAVLFTLPVTRDLFGSFSVLSFLFTALFAVPVTLFLYIGFATLLLLPIPYVSDAAGFLCERSAVLIKRMSEALANGDLIVSLRYDFVPYLFLPTAAILIVGLLIKPKKHIHLRLFFILAAAAVFSLSFFGCYMKDKAEDRGVCTVSYLNCGASEMITAKIDGHGIIIDVSTGGGTGVFAADAVLDEDAVPEPDILILTHLHQYHANTVAKYAGRSFLRKIYLPEPTDGERDYYDAAAEAARNAGLTVHTYVRGADVIKIGDLLVSMPYFGFLKRSVKPVFALSAESGSGKVLYLSSSVWETDFDTEAYAEGCTAVIVGSHGPNLKTEFDCAAAASVYAPERSAGYVKCAFTAVGEDERIKLRLSPAG